MPTSAPYAIPIIASVARQLRPKSVLDVGIGFGKYGFLFREYLDIWDAADVTGCSRANWSTRIDGIEATREYVTELQEFLYDKIHLGDVREVLETLDTYDVVVMGDLLEHFEREVGEALLDVAYAHTDQCLLLTFPLGCARNTNVLNNLHESHLSRWSRKDFRRFPQVGYKTLQGRTAVVAITKPPTRPPVLTPSFAGRRRTGWKGVVSVALTNAFGQHQASRLVSWVLGEQVNLRS